MRYPVFSGELDVRGLSDAMGLPENEVNHRLYGGREPLLVGAGGTMGATASLPKPTQTKHRHPFRFSKQAIDDFWTTEVGITHRPTGPPAPGTRETSPTRSAQGPRQRGFWRNEAHALPFTLQEPDRP
ncbi:hypothetical protein WK32_26955 [Burkholderia vietnamiensis]|nr:hypothetical protein WK32_26955 [Burkholderia vietnamiensis]